MKKVILDLAVSLDGFIEGPNGEIDWCILDDDMDFDGFLADIDTLFYGRVSYVAWGHFQPGEAASEAEKQLWLGVHSKQKIVFSSRQKSDNRAHFIHANIADEVNKIKQQGGKNIWLYGGASLIKTFIQLGLIDVYRISVHPTVLGGGKPLFADLKERMNLQLVKTNAFKSGVVQLIYEPKK